MPLESTGWEFSAKAGWKNRLVKSKAKRMEIALDKDFFALDFPANVMVDDDTAWHILTFSRHYLLTNIAAWSFS